MGQVHTKIVQTVPQAKALSPPLGWQLYFQVASGYLKISASNIASSSQLFHTKPRKNHVPKAKKILISGTLALALLGWRGYDAVKTVKLKEFVEHYNVFINNENRFLTHLNERTDFGSVPEAVMMPVQHSAGFMANSD